MREMSANWAMTLVNHPAAFVRVGQFTPPEDHRHNDLVLVLEKLAGAVDLDLDVVLARLGPHADFLDLGLVRLALVLPLLLLVLVLAVVHDTADGRLLVGRHLDQVQIDLSRGLDGLLRWPGFPTASRRRAITRTGVTRICSLIRCCFFSGSIADVLLY